MGRKAPVVDSVEVIGLRLSFPKKERGHKRSGSAASCVLDKSMPQASQKPKDSGIG